MKLIYIIVFLFSSMIFSIDKSDIVTENFSIASAQYQRMRKVANDLQKYPKSINEAGNTSFTSIKDWTCGFWPGCLWYIYEFSNDADWKCEAIKWTESLEQNQYNKGNHDIGFMMNCSYGNALRLTSNKKYKNILVQSAKSLISRFNPTVGAIKSWDIFRSWDMKSVYQYPVIIDNMMNLELLFNVSRITGDDTYKKIAIKHAETTMKNHFRKDFSSYHVVCYNPINGSILAKETAQGFADNSSWSRGQAWGLYGFTMVYRETKDIKFLEQAYHIADFYLANKTTPEDKIPFWDFNVNQSGFIPKWKYESKIFKIIPRDASAAAIVSSALFELSTFAKGAAKEKYFNAAYEIIKSLSTDEYRAQPGSNGYFILKHSVGSIPHGAEIDVPLVYADYYFLEALLRYKKIIEKKSMNYK